ncbi:MAG: T9SS type A sorting domain-containing protein, partial [Bacteroidales bacterium]|nr:T9SS type A sorting domain-containing protein [Bacteroidales bacterium]
LNIEAEEEILEVGVYNPLGEMVMKLEIGNLEGQVDVSGLENGIYFVEVVTESRNFKSKILIVR